jgi:hypothetical protein
MDEILGRVLGNEQVTNALIQLGGAAITAALGYVTLLVRRYVKDQEKADRLAKVFNDAVWHTYKTYVEERKADWSDAKWDRAEKAEALRRAQELAVDLAKREGIDLIREIGKDAITQKIESTIQGFKSGAIR